MTNNNHPITPPLELVKQWLAEFYGPESMPGMAPGEMVLHVAAVAARWGNHPAKPDSSLQPIPVSERIPSLQDNITSMLELISPTTRRLAALAGLGLVFAVFVATPGYAQMFLLGFQSAVVVVAFFA